MKIRYKKLLKVLQFAAGIILTIFLLFNFIYSQNINSLFNGLAQEDRESTVSFLKKIKKLPDFKNQLQEYETIYGASLVDEVFYDDKLKKHTIDDLKNLLKMNPNEKDILYSLYLLEKENGNMNKAQNYLDQVKELDPAIKN